MKAEDHRKVAQWHLKQADLHESVDGYSCGCPPDTQSKKIIEIVDSGVIEEEKTCALG
ncbi:MAG: hypothetical protein JKY92_04645 [Magnetovibrio sp.]|nr:hypothetical protein [Magnetovibrio sp.]